MRNVTCHIIDMPSMLHNVYIICMAVHHIKCWIWHVACRIYCIIHNVYVITLCFGLAGGRMDGGEEEGGAENNACMHRPLMTKFKTKPILLM